MCDFRVDERDEDFVFFAGVEADEYESDVVSDLGCGKADAVFFGDCLGHLLDKLACFGVYAGDWD